MSVFVMRLSLLLLFVCNCSAIITSNTHRNDPDYEKLSPSPTYFIPQGGYADKDTTMWVDKTGTVTWITHDNKLQKQNLVGLLPSFNFSCTVATGLFPSAVFVAECNRAPLTRQDFFFCPQYNCYPIINATRSYSIIMSSAIVFHKNTQRDELYIYNTQTKQGFSKMVPQPIMTTKCGDFIIVRYSGNSIFVYNPTTGYQIEKIGSLIVNTDTILIIYNEGANNYALLLTDDNEILPKTLSFPSNYDTLSVARSELAVDEYVLLKVNMKTPSTTAVIAYLYQSQRFVEIRCPDNGTTTFADINTLIATPIGVFSVLNTTNLFTHFKMADGSCLKSAFSTYGRGTPYSRTSTTREAFFRVVAVDNSYQELTVVGYEDGLFNSTRDIPSKDSIYTTMRSFAACRIFSDSYTNSHDLVWTPVGWIDPISTTGFYATFEQQLSDSFHLRTWFSWTNSSTEPSLITLNCSDNSYSVTAPLQLKNSGIDSVTISLYSEATIVDPHRMIVISPGALIEIDLDSGESIRSSDTAFAGITSDRVTGRTMTSIVSYAIGSLFLHLSDGQSRATYPFITPVTSLDFFRLVQDNVVIVGPKLATDTVVEELYVVSGMQSSPWRIDTPNISYNTVSYANNRISMYGPSTKQGILCDLDTYTIIRTNYTGTAPSISFSSPSATGYAAMISPQQNGGGRKMAVYSVCTKISDCTAGDTMTYAQCIDNICQYKTCPPENPFLCPTNSPTFTCAASFAMCLI